MTLRLAGEIVAAALLWVSGVLVGLGLGRLRRRAARDGMLGEGDAIPVYWDPPTDDDDPDKTVRISGRALERLRRRLRRGP